MKYKTKKQGGRGIRTGSKKPLEKVYKLRLTDEQFAMIHSAGTTDQYREALVNRARKNLGIDYKPKGFEIEIIKEDK